MTRVNATDRAAVRRLVRQVFEEFMADPCDLEIMRELHLRMTEMYEAHRARENSDEDL